MGEYKKPLVTVDAGLAEGVYAASGAGAAVKLSDLTVSGDWGNGGQVTFTADFSSVDRSQLVLVVIFNQAISGIWGGGASGQVDGNTATCTWYSAPESAELTVGVNAAPSTLKIDSYSYHNN